VVEAFRLWSLVLWSLRGANDGLVRLNNHMGPEAADQIVDPRTGTGRSYGRFHSWGVCLARARPLIRVRMRRRMHMACATTGRRCSQQCSAVQLRTERLRISGDSIAAARRFTASVVVAEVPQTAAAVTRASGRQS
jgi:hypothetical protein